MPPSTSRSVPSGGIGRLQGAVNRWGEHTGRTCHAGDIRRGQGESRAQADRADTRGMTERERSSAAAARSTQAILAVTADDDRYASTRREAARLAAEQHTRLILYDWDSATILGNPLPSAWSGEGTDDATPGELDERDLEAAGRAPLIDQLADARRAGVPVTAWLPADPGPDAMVRWARDHGVTTIVVPEDLQAAGELERLAAGTDDPTREVEVESPVRVVVVPKERAAGS